MVRRVQYLLGMVILLGALCAGTGRALAASSAPLPTAVATAVTSTVGAAQSQAPDARGVEGASTINAAGSDQGVPALPGAAAPTIATAVSSGSTTTAGSTGAATTGTTTSTGAAGATTGTSGVASLLGGIQATQPASQPASQQHGAGSASQVTPARHGAGARPAPTAAPLLHLPGYMPISVPSPSSLDAGGMLQLAGKFALVLIALFICLRVLRALMPGAARAGTGRGAMVLFSEPIGDKQRVCLLDLHVKLALVSISNTGVTPITTIDDVEQVAALRARYQPRQTARRQAPPRPAPSSSFANLLQQEASAAPAPQWAGAPTAPMRGQPTQKLPRVQQAGGMSFGEALATIRSLRQKVEQQ